MIFFQAVLCLDRKKSAAALPVPDCCGLCVFLTVTGQKKEVSSTSTTSCCPSLAMGAVHPFWGKKELLPDADNAYRWPVQAVIHCQV